MSRFSYQQLVELIGGDQELIVRLLEIGVIQQKEDRDVVVVDLDQVLVTRTLVRELEIDWPGVEIILRLLAELGDARRRIAELEAALRQRQG